MHKRVNSRQLCGNACDDNEMYLTYFRQIEKSCVNVTQKRNEEE